MNPKRKQVLDLFQEPVYQAVCTSGLTVDEVLQVLVSHYGYELVPVLVEADE